MDLRLQGKTALVTGSTAGIGLAIAVALAREAATVIVNGRTAARVEQAANAVRDAAMGANVEGVAADLSTTEGVASLLEQWPDVDILVNNLGTAKARAFVDTRDEDWRLAFEVNVMSGVRLGRAYLPGMLKRDWGRIVFISADSALNVPPEMLPYATTKAAQLAVARGMAELTAGTGVTVNAVLPGPTRSEGMETLLSGQARRQGRSAAKVETEFLAGRASSLLRRLARPEEVASLVAYVCSPLASATNGAALRADGGVVRCIV